MKKALLTVLFIIPVFVVKAQINAVTNTGDEVVLFDDGTWKYVDSESIKSAIIPVNKHKFERDDDSNFLVKSKKINVGVYINIQKWSFTKGTDKDAFELQFQLKGEDLYAMSITEKVQVPLESLRNIAIENARSAAPDIKVQKEEYRTVNGTKVLMLQMNGTIQGMKFVYYGYYFSNENGTIQLLTYTSESLFPSYKDDIEDFLNGLYVIE